MIVGWAFRNDYVPIVTHLSLAMADLVASSPLTVTSIINNIKMSLTFGGS